MIMFWRRRKNFLMDWTNALHQASGTMTISVGSKKKWKPRLNCSCVCLNTHLFCFLTHLALWLTVNVFLRERCGENSHLKRPLKEHWSVQLQVGEKNMSNLSLYGNIVVSCTCSWPSFISSENYDMTTYQKKLIMVLNIKFCIWNTLTWCFQRKAH